MMNVLHVLPTLDQRYGGPVRAILDLSSRAISHGLNSEVLGFGAFSVPDNPFPLGKIHTLATAFPRSYGYAPELSAWLNRNLSRFDGVILHGMWLYLNWATAAACRRHNIPYVCFPHGMLEPWAFYGQGPIKAAKKFLFWHIVEQGIHRSAAAVFFTTARERTLARKVFDAGGSKFVVVPYGADMSGTRATLPARLELEIAAGRKMALFLGRVHPKKNVDLLFEAWGRSRPAPEWELIVAGPATPKYRLALERVAEKYSVQEQVRFVGAVSGQDKSYLLGRASWFLLPSKQENFGISVLEAVNAGCPVAISDQVFLGDYFPTGSEILPVRIDAWIDFFRNRMPDEQHRQALMRLDREFVVPQFEMECVVKKWVATISTTFQKT